MHLARLEGRAAERSVGRGDLFLETAALISCAAPITIDLADAAVAAGVPTGPLSPATFDVSEISPFRLPPLGSTAPGMATTAAAR
jgi:hypothetical protein